MINNVKQKIINELVKSLDVPDSAYEAAERRYKDLGEWLQKSPSSKSRTFCPSVSCQGSFRLGTTVRPLSGDDYDLDMACTLTSGLDTDAITQKELKALLGDDLECYRNERGIFEGLEEKHRCWRLNYQDELNFHMDNVPGIPAEDSVRRTVKAGMIKMGQAESLSGKVSEHAVSITDDRHPHYFQKTSGWLVSNPEGYALWFESQMWLAKRFLVKHALDENVASVDEQVPIDMNYESSKSKGIMKH